MIEDLGDRVMNKWPHANAFSVWFAIVLCVIAVTGCGSALAFGESIHPATTSEVSPLETILNLVLIIGAPLAFGFALWRAIVAGRQVEAARRQVEIAQNQAGIALRALSNERYQRGAEMLGSPTLTARLGGIYALQSLAEEHPEDYQPQVIQLFCAYVRDPDGGKEVSFVTPHGSMRLDVAAAIEAINAVRKASSFAEERGLLNLDLRGARLNGMTLRNGNLSRADMTKTVLNGADLEGANLSGVNLTGAELRRTVLNRACLSEAIIHEADLRYVKFCHANLENAQISRSQMQNARFNSASVKGVSIAGRSMTQEQLNQAKGGLQEGPKDLTRSEDPGTGKSLVWHPI